MNKNKLADIDKLNVGDIVTRKNSTHDKYELISINSFGTIKIQGIDNKKFLLMANKKTLLRFFYISLSDTLNSL